GAENLGPPGDRQLQAELLPREAPVARRCLQERGRGEPQRQDGEEQGDESVHGALPGDGWSVLAGLMLGQRPRPSWADCGSIGTVCVQSLFRWATEVLLSGRKWGPADRSNTRQGRVVLAGDPPPGPARHFDAAGLIHVGPGPHLPGPGPPRPC